jgi:putative addiction module component (TIGR02574 family)
MTQVARDAGLEFRVGDRPPQIVPEPLSGSGGTPIIEAMSTPAIDIEKLAPQERLHLISELWESLRSGPESVPPTPAQRAELDRRLDELDQGDVGLVSWDEIKRRRTATLE